MLVVHCSSNHLTQDSVSRRLLSVTRRQLLKLALRFGPFRWKIYKSERYKYICWVINPFLTINFSSITNIGWCFKNSFSLSFSRAKKKQSKTLSSCQYELFPTMFLVTGCRSAANWHVSRNDHGWRSNGGNNSAKAAMMSKLKLNWMRFFFDSFLWDAAANRRFRSNDGLNI